MKMAFDAGKIGGYGSLKTYRVVNGRKVDEQDRGVFKNLVTNKYLSRIGMPMNSPLDELGPAINGYVGMWLGSGGSLPRYTDEKPEAFVRGQDTRHGWVNVDSEFSDRGFSITFRKKESFKPFGTAYNVSELGLGGSSAAYTRTLIRDSAGKPVSINIKADEYLDVTYYFTYNIQLPLTCPVTINGHPSEGDVSLATLRSSLTSYSSSSYSSYFGLALWATEANVGTPVVQGSSNFPKGTKRTVSEIRENKFIMGIEWTLPPSPSEIDFQSLAWHPSNYWSIFFEVNLGKTITIPANHELVASFLISFSRDPEPTE